MEIIYNTGRRWQKRWREVLAGLAELEKWSRGEGDPGLSGEQRKKTPEQFSLDCLHLKDWLINDPAAAVNKKTVEDHAHGSPSISLAMAVANTDKHHTRRPGQTTAWVARAVTPADGSGSVSFLVEWQKPDGSSGSTDALDMATRAVSDWRSFFAAHGLTE
ncbi:hypothetical protein [Kitasatospora sp. NPDC088346]|uniref:hypothetical protein n=1 Tax=Kitasatospora sp. NPDC088346 TaxID=3364073 RepID=UPI003830968C